MAELFKKKKGGKKGAKAPAAAPTPSKPWRKVGRGVALEHADVDEADVAARLEERSAAKAEKDYARADAIAARLQALGVAYDDATREWYVKKPKEAARALFDGVHGALGSPPPLGAPPASIPHLDLLATADEW